MTAAAPQELFIVSGGQDGEGHRQYVARYQVLTDDPADTVVSVLGVMGLAVPIGTAFSFGNDSDSGCWATGKYDATLADQSSGGFRRKWHVDVEFSSRGRKRCNQVTFNTPLDEPWIIDTNFAQFTKAANEDRNGDALLNSAKMPMRGIEEDDSRVVITLEKNKSSRDIPLISSYKDAVNSDPIWGFPKRTLKISAIETRKEFYGVCTAFFPHRYVLHANMDKWNTRALDEGYAIQTGVDPVSGEPTWKVVRDDFGDQVPELVPFNGAGQVKAAGAAAVFREFEISKEKPFSALGLPTTLN